MSFLARFICGLHLRHWRVGVGFFVLAAIGLSAEPAQADALAISSDGDAAVGRYIDYYKEEDGRLSLDDVISVFNRGGVVRSKDKILNFGIGSDPVWLRLKVDNDNAAPADRLLSVETSWLDQMELYFLRDGKVVATRKGGDIYPHDQRPVEDRFYTFPHSFEPGTTTVFLRVEGEDPMVLPVYLSDAAGLAERRKSESWLYGLVYGAILALLIYNLLLFVGLNDGRYLSYSIYLLVFLVMNGSYTGHWYQWLWPDALGWQKWSNPVLMIVFIVAGFSFATRFLGTKDTHPRLYLGVVAGVGLGLGVMALFFLMDFYLGLLLQAFSLIFVFFAGMLGFGLVSLRSGNLSARYFILASISAISGAVITGVTVWSFVPYTVIGFHAMEIGMVLDAILLALALADRLRIVQEEKIVAERIANLDPLTRLNNRRAFYDLVEPIWNTSVRQGHNMSVILVDADRFKKINDKHGHLVGDDTLVRLGETLRRGARAGDILARWGGEEFIVFLPATDRDEAMTVAERIRMEIEQMHKRGAGKEVPLTASLGVATLDEDIHSLESLIEVADQRLYLAKNLGRNRVCAGGGEVLHATFSSQTP